MSPRETNKEHHQEESFLLQEAFTGSPSIGATSKRVSFGPIKCREYNRIVGDHPEARGVPISLSWEHHDLPEQSLNDFERSAISRRRGRRNIRLTPDARKNILMYEFNANRDDIREAERGGDRIRRRREETVMGGKVALRMTRAVKSAKRMLFERAQRENMFVGFAAASGSMMPFGMDAV